MIRTSSDSPNSFRAVDPEIGVQALIARNPELLSHNNDDLRQVPRALAAYNIVALYREMHDALDEYRSLLPTEQELATGTDDIPF